MNRFILLCSIVILLFVSCQADSENEGEHKGKNTMDPRYYQPFVNERLNSFQPIAIEAKGTKAWKFAFNTIEHPGEAMFVHLMDESRGIIDCGSVFFAVDFNKKSTVASMEKSSNTFIRLGEKLELYYFDSYRLQRSGFYKLLEAEPEEPDDDEDTQQTPGEPPDTKPKDSYVPWLGQRSELTAFVPLQKEFICGILHFGTPDQQNMSFILHETPYNDFDAVWEKKFQGLAVASPLGGDNRFIVLLTDEIHMVDTSGRDLQTIKSPGEPVSCSIGPDGMIYIVQETDEDVFLRVFDSFGEKRWEVSGISDAVIQPPIVSDAGIIYLVSEENMVAYRDGERLWAVSLGTDMARATAASGGQVVVVDGGRIICIDENGEEVWAYVDEDGDEFTSPPVIDAQGNIFAASGEKLIKIQ